MTSIPLIIVKIKRILHTIATKEEERKRAYNKKEYDCQCDSPR